MKKIDATDLVMFSAGAIALLYMIGSGPVKGTPANNNPVTCPEYSLWLPTTWHCSDGSSNLPSGGLF